jgi:hypothetical protein
VPGDTQGGPDGGATTDGGTTASTESETGTGSGIDFGRLGRTLALVGFVTAVFVLLTANRLSGALVQVGVVAIGTVAFITAIVGFLVAAGSRFDE